MLQHFDVSCVYADFAVANNIGSVAAKEEVWEVVAQLMGFATSIWVLSMLQESGELTAQSLLSCFECIGFPKLGTCT